MRLFAHCAALTALLLATAGCASRARPVAVTAVPTADAPVPTAPAPVPAAPSPATSASPQVDADPALWVVKDDDTAIYLFGTIHVLKPGLSWFDEAVRTAFDKSDELRLEMVLPDAATAQATAARLGTTPSGPTLPERLPPDTRAKYLATLQGLGLPATALDRFQPWFAANNLVVLPLLKLGYDLGSGADQVLSRTAKASGKPVTGFETMDEQLGFFAGLSEEAQIRFLSSVVEDLPKVGTTIDAMVADWSRGDPASLAKLMNEDLSDSRELSKVLLADRNARWASWIKDRMARPGTVFVAVGAGHLAGKDSVQERLAAQGIRAERVAY